MMHIYTGLMEFFSQMLFHHDVISESHEILLDGVCYLCSSANTHTEIYLGFLGTFP